MNQLGYYGKTPHRGDFVRFNLPQSFVTVWDDWLQHVLVHGEQTHDDWAERYQQAPGYRFVLSSGIAGNDVWVGLLQPSQDKVGRRFPFCLAMSLSETTLPCVCATAQSAWFEKAEALMARVLCSEYAFDDLQQELADLAEHTEQLDPTNNNPVTTRQSSAVDSIAISVPSDNALQHPLVTPAVLDAVLSQTVSEYSVWINRDSSNATTTLASGLPMEGAGLALFTCDWLSGSTVQLEVGALARSVGGALTLFTNDVKGNHSAENSLTQPMDRPPRADNEGLLLNPSRSNDADDATPESNALGNDIAAEAPSAVAEIPSADDWAALDEYDEGSNDAQAVVVPEVEPLELDEDDLPEAPWEK